MKTVITIIRTQDSDKAPKYMARCVNDFLTYEGFTYFRELTRGSIQTFATEEALITTVSKVMPNRELEWVRADGRDKK